MRPRVRSAGDPGRADTSGETEQATVQFADPDFVWPGRWLTNLQGFCPCRVFSPLFRLINSVILAPPKKEVFMKTLNTMLKALSIAMFALLHPFRIGH